MTARVRNTHSMHTVPFSGQVIATTVTDMPVVVADWVHEIRQMRGPLIVGLVCGWRPPSIWTRSKKLATLQLCTQNRCLIVQLLYMFPIPEPLKAFLSDSTVSFVGIGIVKDALRLREEYGLKMSFAWDLERLAVAHKDWVQRGWRSPVNPRLKDFAFKLCGLTIEESLDMTNGSWEERVLSERRVEYGSIEAYASYRLGCKLLQGEPR